MLITHVTPSKLWGKKVYDTNGRFLGEVVAIASRRGVVRKVVVQRTSDAAPIGLLPPTDSHLDGSKLVIPAPEPAMHPRLRVVH